MKKLMQLNSKITRMNYLCMIILVTLFVSTQYISAQPLSLKFGETKPLPKELSNNFQMLGQQGNDIILYNNVVNQYGSDKLILAKIDMDMNVKSIQTTKISGSFLNIGLSGDDIYVIYVTQISVEAYVFDSNTLQQKIKKTIISWDDIKEFRQVGFFYKGGFGLNLNASYFKTSESPSRNYIAIMLEDRSYSITNFAWAKLVYIFDKEMNQIAKETIFPVKKEKIENQSTYVTYTMEMTDEGELLLPMLINDRRNIESLTRKNQLDGVFKATDITAADCKSSLIVYDFSKNGVKSYPFGTLSDSLNISAPIITSFNKDRLDLRIGYSKYTSRWGSGRTYALLEGFDTLHCNLPAKTYSSSGHKPLPESDLIGSGKRWHWDGIRAILDDKYYSPSYEYHPLNGHIFTESGYQKDKDIYVVKELFWMDQNLGSPKKYTFNTYEKQKDFKWHKDHVWLYFTSKDRFYMVDSKDGNTTARSYNYQGDYQEMILEKNSPLTNKPDWIRIGDNKWIVWQVEKINKQWMQRLGVLSAGE